MPTRSAWYPKGYTEFYQDRSVAFRWLKNREFSCDYAGSLCAGLSVVTQNGCPNSLYVEVSVVDGHGTAVDFSNDTAGVLYAGQKANLIFTTFTSSAAFRITKVSCY